MSSVYAKLFEAFELAIKVQSQSAYLFCEVFFLAEYDFVEVGIRDFSVVRKPIWFENDENIFVVAQNRTKFGFVRTQMTPKRPRVDLE
jgi:hypothetical protein